MLSDSRIVEGLDRFAANCADLIFVVNCENLVEYCNPSALELIGGKEERAVRRIFDFFPGSAGGSMERYLKSVFESGRPVAFENNIAVSGREICLDVRLSPVGNGSRTVRAVLGIAREITEQKQRERLIAHSRREWLHAIDGMPYPFAVVDANHQIKRLNRAMAKKLGSNVRDAIGFVCYESLHKTPDPPGFCPLLNGKRTHERPSEIFKHRDGNLLCTVTPVRDKEGKITGCLYFERQTLESDRTVNLRRSSEEYMRMLLKGSDHTVYIQNTDGKYVYFNAMPGDRVPWGLIGGSPFDFFEPEAASQIVRSVKEVVAHGTELAREVDFSWGGEVLRFFDRISPVRDAMGKIKAVMTVSTKAAEFRRLEGQIRAPKAGAKELTGREREVLQLIARGLTSSQVAQTLAISRKTVETHRTRIMQKLDVHKTSALVSYAAKAGLLE